MFQSSKFENAKFKQRVYQMNFQLPIEVVETLQAESVFKIGRTHFAGSFGKKTNVPSSDVDLVCFINNEEPPYQDVLDDFYNILDDFAMKNGFTIERKHLTIRLINDNVKLDLVPATNFVQKVKKRKSTVYRQMKRVLQRIQEYPTENRYKFSASLAEASVIFMKGRVGFANEMARICKQWYKCVKTTEWDYVSGASTFIELVAVYAARKGQRGNKKFNSHLKCFIRFLQSLMNFEKLNVDFGRWYYVLKEHPPGEGKIPRVIDSINPYNNYANNWSSKAIQMVKDSAGNTYKELQDIILNGNCSEDQVIGMLFKS